MSLSDIETVLERERDDEEQPVARVRAVK